MENKIDIFTTDIRKNIEFLVNKKEYDPALLIIEDILNKDPNHLDVLKTKLSILGLMHKHEKLIILADIIIEKIKNDYIIYFKKGVSLYHLKKYNESLLSLNECLKIRPNFHRALSYKISILTILGKHQEAVTLYEESDLDEDGQITSFNNIGYSYLELGNYSKAEEYLIKARSTDSHIKILYNLTELYRRKRSYFKFIEFYIKARLKKFISKYYKISKNKFEWSIDKFIGPGKLFITNSQIRETKAIMKLFKTPHWSALCNDTFIWFAVNIPLHLLENNKSIKGDIDILVKMPETFPFNENTLSRYRSFEVKSILVNRNGKSKSLKTGKHQKIYEQLKKLKKFGSGQVILLEIYALERGFSDCNVFPTTEIEREIINKANLIKNDGFGYLIIKDEASKSIQDGSGGVFYVPDNVLIGYPNIIKSPFVDLVNYLDEFYKREIQKRGFCGLPIITYCKKCKKLILINASEEENKCPNCDYEIF
ncbi:MAG: tetratricopeptide repeat protein [Patescibacteria group bacterium]|nr:tetratricopeptide repeat protein [Patescibacteria group bacterium]